MIQSYNLCKFEIHIKHAMRLKSYQPVRFHRALRVNLSVMSMALDSTLDLTSCSIFLMYRGLAPSEDVWSVDICKKKTVDKNLSKRIILIWSRIIDQLCFKQMIDLSLSLSLFQSSPPPNYNCSPEKILLLSTMKCNSGTYFIYLTDHHCNITHMYNICHHSYLSC